VSALAAPGALAVAEGVEIPQALFRPGGLPGICVVTGKTEGVEWRPFQLEHKRVRADVLVIGAVGQDVQRATLSLPLSDAGLRRAKWTQVHRALIGVLGFLLVMLGIGAVPLALLEPRSLSLGSGGLIAVVALALGVAVLWVGENVVARAGRPTLLEPIGTGAPVQLSLPSSVAASAIREHVKTWRRNAPPPPAPEPEPEPPPPLVALPADQVPDNCPACKGRLVEDGEAPESLAFCFHCGHALAN
jgi:hypothetical protein